MGIFEDFLSDCVSDCVNARQTRLCPTCDNIIEADVSECRSCYDRRESREARNDAGAGEV